MQGKIKSLIDIITSINHYWMVEFVKTDKWCITSDKQFLLWDHEDGEYSGEIIGGDTRVDGYCLINIDNGSGETITFILDEGEELNEEDYMQLR